MSYRKYVTKCRNPHKGLRRETSDRALYSSHRSCFEPFVPPEKLTERQKLLLSGNHPNPNKREMSALLRKLKHHNRLIEADIVFERYKHYYQEVHESDLSPIDAASILDDLTPDELR